MIIFAARSLADYIGTVEDFPKVIAPRPAYTHMGALLADAILQAGVAYANVVIPRVNLILQAYPQAETLSRFQSVLAERGAKAVLQWRHDEKPRRLEAVVSVFTSAGVDSVSDLGLWCENKHNRLRLLQVKGIGEKTVAYLSGLLGLDVVAVDRHLLAFLRNAGITASSRDYAAVVVGYAADILGVSRLGLDRAIWQHQSRPVKARPRLGYQT